MNGIHLAGLLNHNIPVIPTDIGFDNLELRFVENRREAIMKKSIKNTMAVVLAITSVLCFPASQSLLRTSAIRRLQLTTSSSIFPTQSLMSMRITEL